MTWTAPRTWVLSEVITNAVLNLHIRDNSRELGPFKVSAKGDLLVGSANTSIGTVAVGTNNQVLAPDSAQTLGIKWITSPIDDQFGTKGDLLVGSAVDVGTILPILGNSSDGLVLVANSKKAIGIEWGGSPAIIGRDVLANVLLGNL